MNKPLAFTVSASLQTRECLQMEVGNAKFIEGPFQNPPVSFVS